MILVFITFRTNLLQIAYIATFNQTNNMWLVVVTIWKLCRLLSAPKTLLLVVIIVNTSLLSITCNLEQCNEHSTHVDLGQDLILYIYDIRFIKVTS